MRIISGKYRGKKLLSPQSEGVRPTSDRARESVFNILNNRLESSWENYALLDVFCGTGAFALEAVSRGAKKVCLVDKNIKNAELNVKLFPSEKDKIILIKANAESLPQTTQKYNLLFMDAPYNQGLSTPALESLHKNKWLEEGCLCIVEVEKNESIKIPPAFEVQEERIYGLAKFIFLAYHP